MKILWNQSRIWCSILCIICILWTDLLITFCILWIDQFIRFFILWTDLLIKFQWITYPTTNSNTLFLSNCLVGPIRPVLTSRARFFRRARGISEVSTPVLNFPRFFSKCFLSFYHQRIPFLACIYLLENILFWK